MNFMDHKDKGKSCLPEIMVYQEKEASLRALKTYLKPFFNEEGGAMGLP